MRDDKTKPTCEHKRTTYALGNTYCEDCKEWLYAGREAIAPPQAAPTVNLANGTLYVDPNNSDHLSDKPFGVAPQAEAPTPTQHMTNSEAVQWMLNLRNGFEPETKTFRAISKAIKALELGAAEAPKPDPDLWAAKLRTPCPYCSRKIVGKHMNRHLETIHPGQACTGNRQSPSVAESRPSAEEVRKLAIEILSNCALHYANPQFYSSDNPQSAIDNAISNATKFIEEWMQERITRPTEPTERKP
jgi:hypothetical protein